MWYLVGALGLGGAATALWLLWRKSVVEKHAVWLAGQLGVARDDLLDVRRERDSALMRLRESEGRHATEVSYLRAEIQSLEDDMAVCLDPAVVRARLHRLLQDPTPRGARPPTSSLSGGRTGSGVVPGRNG